MIETTTNKQVYIIQDNPVFAFGIPFFTADNIHCYLYDGETEIELVRGEDFTVESKADYSGGANVILLRESLVDIEGQKLTIVRKVPLTQDVNLPEYGKLPVVPLEKQLDKLIMICQQLKEITARSFAVPHGMEDYDNDEIYNAFNDMVNHAEQWAEEAQTGANSAANSATAALGFANTARGYELRANTAASNAVAAAESAAESAVNAGEDADDIRELSEEASLNCVTLDYGDWGSDGGALLSYDTWTPAATIRGATVQIAEHNGASDAHPFILGSIESAMNEAISLATAALNSHDTNEESHSIIRASVANAKVTAEIAKASAANATPEQSFDGTIWKRQWKNGWIEYRFVCNITTSDQTVTLPIEMENTNYYVSGNCLQKARYASCYDKTVTSMKVYTGNDSSFDASEVEFLVIGQRRLI